MRLMAVIWIYRVEQKNWIMRFVFLPSYFSFFEIAEKFVVTKTASEDLLTRGTKNKFRTSWEDPITRLSVCEIRMAAIWISFFSILFEGPRRSNKCNNQNFLPYK